MVQPDDDEPKDQLFWDELSRQNSIRQYFRRRSFTWRLVLYVHRGGDKCWLFLLLLHMVEQGKIRLIFFVVAYHIISFHIISYHIPIPIPRNCFWGILGKVKQYRELLVAGELKNPFRKTNRRIARKACAHMCLKIGYPLNSPVMLYFR